MMHRGAERLSRRFLNDVKLLLLLIEWCHGRALALKSFIVGRMSRLMDHRFVRQPQVLSLLRPSETCTGM